MKPVGNPLAHQAMISSYLSRPLTVSYGTGCMVIYIAENSDRHLPNKKRYLQ